MSTRSRDLSPPNRWTTRDGSLNCRPRRNRSLIKLKMVVFSPMPIASVIIASAEKPGDLRSCRRANRMSFIGLVFSDCSFLISFGSQGDDRIDIGGAARGDEAGNQ